MTSANALDPARLMLLREAARTADACDALHVDAEDTEGPERRRILAELRQQRLALARLVAATLPEGTERADNGTANSRLAQLRANHAQFRALQQRPS
ncbi:hypothetical protein [Geodermatophilus sp. SYSU D00684]